MDAREAVLAAAAVGVRADTAEEGLAAIREATRTTFSDAELGEAVATAIANGQVRDPVRLPAGALQCHWRLEMAPAASDPRANE